MQNKETKFHFFNKPTMLVFGILLMFLSAITLVWQGNKNSTQSTPAMIASVYFAGEYRIGDGEWKEIVKGEHISSTKGRVTLRGNFHVLNPIGEYEGVYSDEIPIVFYINHINLTFVMGGQSYVIEHENIKFGKSSCGETWYVPEFTNYGNVFEIIIDNPHNFGNENAIDEMLNNVALWDGMGFEKDVLEKGETQRNTGLFFVIASVMFLGTALFSSLIHVKNSKTIWLLGLVILFAGLYQVYSSFGISFWSESIVSNTSILGISMMLYSFFLSLLITSTLKILKNVGAIVSIGLGVVVTMFFVLSMTTKLFFYNTLLYWAIIQNVANLTLIVCLIKDLICAENKEKVIYIGAFLPLISFGVDTVATYFGVWQGGLASRFVFVILFVVAMVMLIRIIPSSINALTKAKELETEKLVLNTQLAESRVSTMMSQIRPHFIYNTLGSIEQLCELDPPKAGELVHNFAKYLRGNFGELDNPKPILMSQEMEHVHYYINIENVRFPDMTFTFEMNSNDFRIPALTIQPIVENAIKHGLMKLSKGGTIRVVSYETDTDYCVLVEDDGVGFDTSVLIDERKHVGIRNIRGRLEAMVNGTLEIESEIDKGTKVLITIPKVENDETFESKIQEKNKRHFKE